jgi:F-type H+-transporting ATPase subunit gamma
MPSLIDIRRRIRSVKNTQQITRAMKMVAAAKLRRAQDRVIAARPYARIMREILENVVAAAAGSEEANTNPLLARREEQRLEVLVVTADRGLAGAFNANVIRATQQFLRDHAGREVILDLIGRRGRDFFRRRHRNISGEYTTLFLRGAIDYDPALEIAQAVIERFERAETDAVYIIGNQFKSVMSANLIVEKILPFDLPEGGPAVDYIFEQPAGEILHELLPRYVRNQIFRSLLESVAAEQAARMTAMDAASRNAGEVIDKLTLNMNRVRQAGITREIIEIVSGANALNQ